MTKGFATRIKAGDDPRALPDYQTMCAEMGRLGHPACPDVDWQFIERCCLSLFASNGADLQTASAYALARSHLAGLDGMSEGVAVLESLKWADARPWPRNASARAEILRHLFSQWQAVLREMEINTGDLADLGRLNVQLEHLCRTLPGQKPVPISTLEGLRQQIAQRASRIEREVQAVKQVTPNGGQHSPSQPPSDSPSRIGPAATQLTVPHSRPHKKKRRALWFGLLAAALVSLIAALAMA